VNEKFNRETRKIHEKETTRIVRFGGASVRASRVSQNVFAAREDARPTNLPKDPV
jgi:hypothetical protein